MESVFVLGEGEGLERRREETSLKTKKVFLVTRKTHNLSLPALCGCGTLGSSSPTFVCVCAGWRRHERDFPQNVMRKKQ